MLSGLARTRQILTSGLQGLFKHADSLDPTLFEEIEDQLLMADIGVDASQSIVDEIRGVAKQEGLSDPAQLYGAFKDGLMTRLEKVEQPLRVEMVGRPFVILMVGVNGAGKTTTLAKLANFYQALDKQVMFAACDTFRAAAIEQLQIWGERMNVPVIAQSHGADPAAVAYDAYQAALARDVEILLIDTAGRQHTHSDLMAQVGKIIRVLSKANDGIPDEVLMTIDAGNGQNVLSQVEHFHSAIGVSGLCISKLDGTAKGGVVIALSERFGIPIRYIGTGEKLEDFESFKASQFVNALLPRE